MTTKGREMKESKREGGREREREKTQVEKV
jgi:hypothetical protein